MTQRIAGLLKLLKSGQYRAARTYKEIVLPEGLKDLSPAMLSAHILKATLEKETPNIFENDRIGFNRVNTKYYAGVHRPGNIVPDYETMLNRGMGAVKAEVIAALKHCAEDKKDYYNAVLTTLNAALELAHRYREKAKEIGADELYRALCRVPEKGASTLLEACVFMKFIIFTLRCNHNDHITLGRFDKYMRPFYYSDLKAGKTRAELLEVIEEFFISINFDTDLYCGVQQGDNGQSLVLGGQDTFDDFSHLCMEASLELNLIDPKINLRVDKNTPDELYEFATLMTKQGMGFPQYSNDDVVIPGLIALGYESEDAADYAVAACWEFIIPSKGMDVPNIATMNYPKVVDKAVREHLKDSETFDEFIAAVELCLKQECEDILALRAHYKLPSSPYLSVFIKDCIKRGEDISCRGAIYNNFGCHGAGIATAADSLAAINEVIFKAKEISKQELIDALDKDFEGYGELRNRLLACPKMGNARSCVDELAYTLMETFAKNINGKPNSMGGIWRAGTGSAHEYFYSARNVGATADGRKAYSFYGSSFSPSLEARLQGPLSCVRSFTGFDLKKVINGGPLTLELHDTVFRNGEGIKKAAQLVKAYIHLGGHQLQLNCINRDTLLDAMEHPEDHKNLIVRVWGWSGYFNELSAPFKEHIIRRTEFII